VHSDVGDLAAPPVNIVLTVSSFCVILYRLLAAFKESVSSSSSSSEQQSDEQITVAAAAGAALSAACALAKGSDHIDTLTAK
jgi:hypothetical protein